MEYTKETIFHFNCSDCKNWWSYATDEDYQINSKEIHCMHCGKKGIPKEKQYGLLTTQPNSAS